MRVYIQKDFTGEFLNVNCFTAYAGFSLMGWEVIGFEKLPPEGLHREDIVVGYISSVKTALINLGITPPEELDYPEELNEFYGRKLWKSQLSIIANSPEMYPVFIKPVLGKQFDGRLVKSFKDLIACGSNSEDREIWCSEPVNFIAEYRCFIKYGIVVDARLYKGDWSKVINADVVKHCVEKFTKQPASYTLDFGVTDDGRTLLVEANLGFSLGAYGLQPLDYAKNISACWAEMTDTIDHCRF